MYNRHPGALVWARCEAPPVSHTEQMPTNLRISWSRGPVLPLDNVSKLMTGTGGVDEGAAAGDTTGPPSAAAGDWTVPSPDGCVCTTLDVWNAGCGIPWRMTGDNECCGSLCREPVGEDDLLAMRCVTVAGSGSAASGRTWFEEPAMPCHWLPGTCDSCVFAVRSESPVLGGAGATSVTVTSGVPPWPADAVPLAPHSDVGKAVWESCGTLGG